MRLKFFLQDHILAAELLATYGSIHACRLGMLLFACGVGKGSDVISGAGVRYMQLRGGGAGEANPLLLLESALGTISSHDTAASGQTLNATDHAHQSDLQHHTHAACGHWPHSILVTLCMTLSSQKVHPANPSTIQSICEWVGEGEKGCCWALLHMPGSVTLTSNTTYTQQMPSSSAYIRLDTSTRPSRPNAASATSS
jgi:hypothetical protein